MYQQSLYPSSIAGGVHWTPNHSAAQDRLTNFLPYAAVAYAKGRNYDLGPENRSNVSALSPWIRSRLLLETDVIQQVLKTHTAQDADKFVQEVLWRGYFKGWLEQHPQMWARYKKGVVQQLDRTETDASLASRYNDALTARTGIDCFDAWTSELLLTGYLHNHARMWYASIWVFTLGLPWELGADFFLRHLLDGDPASNTCSWRWVTGLHTKGKIYLAQASNIATYTEQRFNPDGLLAESASALQEEPQKYQPLRFDSPNLQGIRVGLLITEEDCSAHRLDFKGDVTAVLALTNFTQRSILTSPPLVEDFTTQAVASAAERAAQTLSCPVSTKASDDWHEALAEWASSNQLDVIITARVTQGPVRKRLFQAIEDFKVELIEVTRHYDQLVWPESKAGFFRLKKKIPKILASLTQHEAPKN